jgi:hypothetical protein
MIHKHTPQRGREVRGECYVKGGEWKRMDEFSPDILRLLLFRLASCFVAVKLVFLSSGS